MPPFLADVLTWPGNRQYVTYIVAARSYSIPPTVLLLRDRQPSDGWSQVDKKLAVALQILEDETCSDCGIPVWLGHSDDKDIQFEVKSRVCYSCAEIEKDQEEKPGRKSKRKPTKGEKKFLQQTGSSNNQSRDRYYSGIMEE